jgi:hypothetical protein
LDSWILADINSIARWNSEYNTLKVIWKYLLKNNLKLINMKNRQDKVACSKCGKMILPSTAERYQGKCAPCAKKANEKWSKPLLSGAHSHFHGSSVKYNG